MPSSSQEYHFVAPVLRLQQGLRQHYVPVPPAIADALQAAGHRRVIAVLNGHSVRRALQGRKDGERYLALGRAVLREVGAAFGEMVTVELAPDPNPDHVELGEELRTVLEQDPEAAARFNSFPPGRRRSLAYHVTSARRVETRIARALDLAHKIKTHTLYSDRQDDD